MATQVNTALALQVAEWLNMQDAVSVLITVGGQTIWSDVEWRDCGVSLHPWDGHAVYDDMIIRDEVVTFISCLLMVCIVTSGRSSDVRSVDLLLRQADPISYNPVSVIRR